MSDYISREAAIDDICSRLNWSDLEGNPIPQEAIKAYIADLINHVPAADVRPRWIPVTERLPEEGVYVLAYCADDDYMCVEAHHKFAAFQITHWQPLPQPPKEEET